jgi:vacuolar-type H+-ATPase catalytic subunit A/Vma1
MLNKWLINLAISFLVRQLAKFGKSINWQKVKEDLKTRTEALVPGSWFDDEAVALVFTVVDAAATVLASVSEIEKVLQLVAQEKWEEAIQTVKELILRSWPAKAANAEVVVACLQEDLASQAA